MSAPRSIVAIDEAENHKGTVVRCFPFFNSGDGILDPCMSSARDNLGFVCWMMVSEKTNFANTFDK
jgi:hypothetical protein